MTFPVSPMNRISRGQMDTNNGQYDSYYDVNNPYDIDNNGTAINTYNIASPNLSYT